jgi:predicted ester cyclase
VTYHGPAGEERKGRNAAIDVARTFRSAFPDVTIQLEQLVGEGDFVVSRVRLSGTHKGEFNGIAPTGKKIDLKWVMNMVCIKNGKVIEEWEMYDQLDLYEAAWNSGIIFTL